MIRIYPTFSTLTPRDRCLGLKKLMDNISISVKNNFKIDPSLGIILEHGFIEMHGPMNRNNPFLRRSSSYSNINHDSGLNIHTGQELGMEPVKSVFLTVL